VHLVDLQTFTYFHQNTRHIHVIRKMNIYFIRKN